MYHTKKLAAQIFAGSFLIAILGTVVIGNQYVAAPLPTASILGIAKDSTGAVVPGAALTAPQVEWGQSRTTVSSADGSVPIFHFRGALVKAENRLPKRQYGGFRDRWGAVGDHGEIQGIKYALQGLGGGRTGVYS